MSSMFDSAVYALRKAAPFAVPSVIQFMTGKAYHLVPGETVRFEVADRPEVATGLWWTVTWSMDGKTYSQSAQEWDLCLWRAIQRSKEIARQLQGERYVARNLLQGWENGDGI